MKFEFIEHKEVNQDGTFKNHPGAVETRGTVRMSKGEGCDLPDCHCSDGYWILILAPIEGDVCRGMFVSFDDHAEMETFLNNHQITGG